MDQPSPQATLDKRVAQYIMLRDKIAELDKAHKEKMAPFREALEKLNSDLLARIDAIGTDSATIKGVGTVYRTMKKSATTADASALRAHVISSQDFDLVDWKPNAPAVEAFIKQHGSPPPGVNYTTHFEVGVRRDQLKTK